MYVQAQEDTTHLWVRDVGTHARVASTRRDEEGGHYDKCRHELLGTSYCHSAVTSLEAGSSQRPKLLVSPKAA